jgi:very-short-patch-repair endonuclease
MKKAQKHSEESLKKLSESLKGRLPWNKGKKRRPSPLKGRSFSEGHKRKLSEAHKGLPSGRKGKTHSEEAKHKMSIAKKGYAAWNKGKKHTEESRQKMSEALKGDNHPNYGKTLSEKTRHKIGEANRGRKFGPHSDEWKEKIRKYWDDPAYVKKCLGFAKPNKQELEIAKLLNDLFPNEYKFVGNGDFVLGGKVPDFVNVNGQKKLIEFNGEYWHRNDIGGARTEHFKQYGFETLIIWGKELKNPETLKQKLLQFHNR